MKPLKNGMQYGNFGAFDGKTINIRPHRFAWFLYNGAIPDGKGIMHECDVPLCCNPNHLKPGTQKENIHDARDKGRIPHGPNHCNAKLTENQARHAKYSDADPKILAKQWNVDPSAITKIRDGSNWKHI